MALEPRQPTAEPAENAELVDFRRRFRWTLPLSLVVFVLGMSDLIPEQPVHHALGGALAWAELVLATPVVVWAGWPLLVRGAASLRTRHLSPTDSYTRKFRVIVDLRCNPAKSARGRVYNVNLPCDRFCMWTVG